jgi:anti-sigma regulatory factor (Ser/Thr protein kinase)
MNMKELDILAVKENLPEVLAFIDSQLEELNCGIKIITQVDVAVEEIFVNISSYAYNPETGPATIRAEITEEPLSVIISFIDNGKQYDPLAKPDPNVKIPLKERKKGGLGIFMVKKTMDDVSYEYKDGQNILTIIKTIS